MGSSRPSQNHVRQMLNRATVIYPLVIMQDLTTVYLSNLLGFGFGFGCRR